MAFPAGWMPRKRTVHLPRLLRACRGTRSQADFARDLRISYTFAHAMEAGTRFPSEGSMEALARRLKVDAGFLALCVHCDRSPSLAKYMRDQGLLPTARSTRRALAAYRRRERTALAAAKKTRKGERVLTPVGVPGGRTPAQTRPSARPGGESRKQQVVGSRGEPRAEE